MENSLGIFELDFKDGKIRIQRHFVSNQTINRVIFSDKKRPFSCNQVTYR